jgi:hypothetical protein
VSENNNLRGSIILVIIGFAFMVLGGLASAAEEATHFGILFLSLGAAVVAIGILVEFFSLAPLLISIARSSQEAASLLKTHPQATDSSRSIQLPLSTPPPQPNISRPQPASSSSSKDPLITLKL